jgi:hypothetical protein
MLQYQTAAPGPDTMAQARHAPLWNTTTDASLGSLSKLRDSTAWQIAIKPHFLSALTLGELTET